MVILSWIFERQLALRHRALRGYFKIKTIEEFNESEFRYKHLPSAHLRPSSSDLHQRCPSRDQLDVVCPCEGASNYVHNLKVKYGLHVAIVQAKILPN